MMEWEAARKLVRRIREIRVQRFGEGGGTPLAEILGLPEWTGHDDESGVTIPALVILRFIDVTGASPRWLLNGEGDKYDLRRQKSVSEPPLNHAVLPRRAGAP